jgi:signal transduction histidine kinase/DNA-binding response OmpR family regulator/HAMP domain-containing protein
MIKKWLSNLAIRKKLNVITFIALISIIVMGFAANYFYRTARVLAIIIDAERVHTLRFQMGIEDFYQYLLTDDLAHIEKAKENISYANKMAKTFGEAPIALQTTSKRDYSLVLLDALDEVLQGRFADARLMTDRIQLMLRLGNKDFQKGLDLATVGAEKGETILSIIDVYVDNPSEKTMHELRLAIDDIHDYYRQFAAAIGQIINFANRLLIGGILVITLLLGAIALLLSFYISGIISKSVNQLVENFGEISQGNIDKRIEVTTKDEIGELSRSFGIMQTGLQQLVDQMQKVADGDYAVSIKPKSVKDRLSIALNKMTEALRKASDFNESQNWLKTGQNLLNEKMRGDNDLHTLTLNIISFLAEYLHAQVGAVYLPDSDDKSLSLYGSYAFIKRKTLSDRFQIGEGLVGQAAFGKQAISLTDVPEDYTRIASATGDMRPRNVIVQPLVYDGQLAGVIELAFKDVVNDSKMEFLQLVSENIAISIHSAIARVKLAELLQQTQQQAEELQTQQEELKVANEELEEQTKALKESERELQSQQEELRVTNEELEEKTNSLETQKEEINYKNIELQRAKAELEDKARELEITSKYKSEFLANMSHELRTPLNSLLILSKNLLQNKKKNLVPDQLESVEIINKSGKDLLNLINEILDLSKIESGKMDINIETLKVEDIANNIKRNFNHVISEKGLDLQVNISSRMPETIQLDIIRLEQVIKNLISNAIKFTNEGVITVDFAPAGEHHTISRSDIHPDKFFTISVKDTGIGIPHEKQKIIFEAFQQADGSTSRNYGGTGLGLSICREIVRLFGGEIQLESEVGQGSVFTVLLPFKYSKLKSNAEISETDVIREFKPKRTIKKEVETDLNLLMPIEDDQKALAADDLIILAIEDDLNFARILKNQCHEKGFKFLHAVTGESGLKMAEKYLPDAILLDIKLPGIDGITVLDRIKDNSKLRHIPVHIMSALEETIDVYQKGAIGYLHKPVDEGMMDQAFTKIKDIINKDVKDLLIIEDDKTMLDHIIEVIGHEGVKPVGANTAKMAFDLLLEKKFDCIVLDLGLPDMSGFDLLKMTEKEGIEMPPVIIYTGKDLTKEENNLLKKYAESIIIKGVKSEERLLDETALFLHRVVERLPSKKQQIITNLHDKESSLKGKKALIVDDDMRNLFALSKVLDEKGMKIIEAENGKVALEKIEAQKDIDIVLMDIMMPVMDGYEAMRRIRQKPQFKTLPVIALTAKAMKDDVEKCIAAGANDYLAKPIEIEKLISLMSVWLYK